MTKNKTKQTKEKKDHTSRVADTPDQETRPHFWKRLPRLFGIGMGMGTADLIPGVSGGTVAFIFGIYQELLRSIKLATGDAVQAVLRGDIRGAFRIVPFSFLVPVGVGIITAILLLSEIFSWLLKEYPSHVWGFFFGLVIASIVLISQRVTRWRPLHASAFAIGAIITFAVVGMVPVETPATLPMFFFSGMIAISAMILPGISGSFILLIMGKYGQVLEAVTDRDVLVLGVFMLGCILGIALFSRVLTWLFSRYHDVAVATLAGVMLGSLRKLWPWKEVVQTRINSHGETVPVVELNTLPSQMDSGVAMVIILAFLGAALIFFLQSREVVKEKRVGVE